MSEQTSQGRWQKFIEGLKKAFMEIEKFLVKLFTFWKKVEKKLDEAGLLPQLEEDAKKADLKSSEETKTATPKADEKGSAESGSVSGDVVTIPPATGGSDLTATGTDKKAE